MVMTLNWGLGVQGSKFHSTQPLCDLGGNAWSRLELLGKTLIHWIKFNVLSSLS